MDNEILDLRNHGLFMVMESTGKIVGPRSYRATVTQPEGGFKVFTSGAQARAVAYKLATENPGKEFIVVRTMCVMHAPEPTAAKIEC